MHESGVELARTLVFGERRLEPLAHGDGGRERAMPRDAREDGRERVARHGGDVAVERVEHVGLALQQRLGVAERGENAQLEHEAQHGDARQRRGVGRL